MKRSKMKTMKKRILALLLCGTMVLNTGVSASADEGTTIIPENTHVHTEECYEKSKTENLICTKPEVAEEAAHVHEEKCFEVTFDQKLTCTQEETAGHSHSDSCVETKDVLTCGTDEHTHGGECYTTETKNVCGQEESETHTHDAGCVEETETLTCSVSEHTHGGDCYTTETNIVCGQEEVAAHAHGEGCYTTVENKTQICTLEEVEAHTHGDECYEWEENLVCTIPEGTPVQLNETEAVQEPVEEQKEEVVEEETKEVTLQNDDETGIKVSIESTSDVLAEDAKVVVAPMELDETMENALSEATGEFEVLGCVAYDISLKNADDTDVSLGENTVDVTIDFEEAIPEEIDAEKVKEVVLAHITTDDDENVVAETVGTVEITEEKATVEFEAESFSPYIVTYLGEEEVVEEPVVEDVVLTYTSEDGKYTVTATAKPEIMENVAALEATLITETTKVEEITKKLIARATEAKKTSLGFEAFEYKFFDAEGNEVAVNGEVRISLSYENAMIPEAADAENVDAVETALLETEEEVLEEINGLVSAEESAVKEIVYTTEAPKELILAWSGDVYRTLPNYEDDEVVITLAGTEYALQNVVGFNVTPIKEDNEETKEQYAEVAQQLEEKIAEDNEANEEEKEVVGFLAYDITLVDAEGNELEPQGDVRVSMEYKEAAAPETVAEIPEAEVTLHHFEEDEKGEVKQIVDMVAEETIEATVEVTKAAEVEKVEFVTGSFSTYTLTWTKYNNSITARIVDESGNLINGLPEEIKIENELGNDKEYIFAVECADLEISGKTYVLKRAVYTKETFENGKNILAVRFHDGSWDRFQYRTTATEWNNFDTNYEIYLVYEELEPLHEVETVNHSGTGIIMRMIDYNPTDTQYGNGGRSFYGLGGGWSDENRSINWFNHGIKAGLVKRILENGYPVTSGIGNGVANTSLKGAFEGGEVVNNLFIKEKYDSTGYYEYNSLENYAYLNSDGNFTVYQELGTPADSGDAAYYNRGNFFPYNEIVAGKFSECQNLYDVNDESLTGERAGEQLYKTQGETNYLFGMYLEVPFVQPENGQIDPTNSGSLQNMKYEFVGDDDLWIFINDVLVLDIGGVHDARAGQIDFATGAVTYNTELPSTTIKAMFRAAGVFPDGTEWVEDRAGEYFRGETFADYSSLTMKMFYMERGKGASNLYVKFNIPPVEKETVTVKKEITNYAAGAYSDVEFSYKLYLGSEKKPENLAPAGTKYTYIKADGTETEGTVKADGTFVLKHKEQAIFNDIAEIGTKYIVEEVGISSETYDKVDITATGVVNENDSDISELEESVATRPLEVGKDFFVLFKNTCAATNMKHIVVEKELNGQSSDSYSVEVTVAGQPYTGKYKVGNSYAEALASETVHEATGAGVITLNAGEVAVVLGYVTKTDEDGNVSYGIPSGTSFKVKETGLEQSKYNSPVYSVYSYDDDGTINTEKYATNAQVHNEGYEGYVDGTLILDANPVVHIKNELMKGQDNPLIKVEKIFSGLLENQIASLAENFKITVTNEAAQTVELKLSDANVEKAVLENGDIKYIWLLENYPAGTYTVKETGETLANYDVTTLLNGETIASGQTENSGTTITTEAATVNYLPRRREPKCSQERWEIGKQNLIVSKLTDGYFVWTTTKANVSERLAIINLINLKENQGGIGFDPEATMENCYFYSGDISDTLSFREGTITYDGNDILEFTYTKQWAMFATGTYTVTDATSAEIAFKNTYTPSTIDMDLKKISVNGSVLEGAEFILYKYDAESTTDPWPVEKLKIIATDVTGAALELTGLGSGRYKLVEIKAPEGFFLLEDDIYFKVENRVAKLTDANGVEISNVQEMWKLDSVGSSLTVKNNLLYELPSTGGHGIYTTMLSGFALMLGAAYVWFMNRRKEML